MLDWIREQEGQTLAEYGLILALIAAVCVIAVALLGTQVNDVLSTIAGSI